jgi:signal transduction histidine kinase
LIFKEALHNIVKYADCKVVSIKIFSHNDDLIMIIKDNGKGFNVSQTAENEILSGGRYLGGNGIKNMNARAVDINANFCISSRINEGTTVQLTLHL